MMLRSKLDRDLMSYIAEFVRDWTPTLAVFATGLWVVFNYYREERVRRETDIPAMDGSLKIAVTCLTAEKSVVAINAVWRNRGAVPVRMMTRETRIEIFTIPADVPCGALTGADKLGPPMATYLPYAEQETFLFEPRTRSELQCHVALENRAVYLIRWNLLLDIDDPKIHPWHNLREIVCDLRTREAV